MKNQSEAAAAAHELPADAKLMQLAAGCFVSQAVFLAAKLGIADLLANDAMSAGTLAKETKTDERSLYRLLRSLASVGVFAEVKDRTFENTPISETLRTDHPNSTRDLAIWIGEPEHWRVYGDMMHSVRTGKPAWDHVHGEPVFPYLFNTNKDLGNIFNRAMTSYSHQSISGVLASYDFTGVQTIADIAGGLGHLLAAILKEYPGSKGVLFDLKEVLADAPRMLSNYGVADRVELIEGDFFKEISVAADAYLLKHIIHDWYDDNCERILRNIRNVMHDDSRVLIIDAVIPEGNGPHMGKIIDLEMLIAPGGVERTAEEFRVLLERSGFRLNRIIDTPSPMSIVEAVKAGG